MSTYALTATSNNTEEIIITGTLAEILQEVETYATETIEHTHHGALDQLTPEKVLQFAAPLLNAEHLEIHPKESVPLAKLYREDFYRLLSGQLTPFVRTRLIDTDQPELTKALPFISIYNPYISDDMLNAFTKATLALWQQAVRGIYTHYDPATMPHWVSEYTALSATEIYQLVDYQTKGQAAFRKFERLAQTTPAPDRKTLTPLLDILKTSYDQNTTAQPAATAAMIRTLLTPTYARYWSQSTPQETELLTERIFWESFGLIMGRRFSESNPMSVGVADKTEKRRRAGYQYMGKVLVRFAGFSKAQTIDALRVSKPWLDNVLAPVH